MGLLLVSLQLLVIFALVAETFCFPNGAPSSACDSLTPNHGASSQDVSTNPYELSISQLLTPSGSFAYLPGASYTGNMNCP